MSNEIVYSIYIFLISVLCYFIYNIMLYVDKEKSVAVLTLLFGVIAYTYLFTWVREQTRYFNEQKNTIQNIVELVNQDAKIKYYIGPKLNDNKYLIYKYKDNYYLHIITAKLKDKKTRKWVDAIVYADKSGNIYVREKSDFDSKFKPMILNVGDKENEKK